MAEPYYQDETVTLWHGDAATILAGLPDASVDCVVTSPPYFGLRDYGVDGQIGAEPSPAEYVASLVLVFREIHRVLTNDGTLWLNIGDSYYSGRGNPGPNADDRKSQARRGWKRVVDQPGAEWGTRKSLIGVPWRLAFALMDDGWILRNDAIWHKPNAMPESVNDRLSCRKEYLFLLTKSQRYWFNLDPIKVPTQERASGKTATTAAAYGEHAGTDVASRRFGGNPTSTLGTFKQASRNPGDVWSIPTAPFPEGHFAAFPPEIPRRCIASGCKPGGVVLDPFHGSGTTGMVAQQLGRRYIGVDLSADYLDLSLRTRLADGALPFEVTA